MMRATILLAGIVSIAPALAQTNWPPHGFVPDAGTAIAIARAVLIPIYGAAQVRAEEPLVAQRSGENWDVSGTFHCPGSPKSTDCVGGVASVLLASKDGRIIAVTHTK